MAPSNHSLRACALAVVVALAACSGGRAGKSADPADAGRGAPPAVEAPPAEAPTAKAEVVIPPGNTADGLADALARSTREKKPLVALFFATWCPACKELEAEVLPDARVQKALGDVVFVRFDVDTPVGGELAGEVGIESIPTFIVFDGKGKARNRLVGPKVEQLLALTAEAGKRAD
jgi:thiol:disulfide interchange protein DsbD